MSLWAVHAPAAPATVMEREFTFNPPVIEERPDGTCLVVMPETRPDDIPGRPALPLFGVSLKIPRGMSAAAISISRGPSAAIPLDRPVACAQPFFKPGSPPVTTQPDPAVYSENSPYPSDHRLFWRTDDTGGETLLSLSFAPLQYNPVANTLLYADSITLNVTLAQDPQADDSRAALLDAFASPLDPAERCDYLVLSTSNLIARATPPWDFAALLTQREHSGFVTKILPVEWVYANYDGIDQPAQIRRFLQDAHALWGVKYLLIAGTHQLIPARKLYISISGFFSNTVDEIPSDHIYYGCMEGSFDGNGNGRYGEYNDGDGGGDVDLTAEILVGRFPVESAAELSRMVRKTLHYDNAARGHFLNNGFVSEKVDFGSIVYGEPFMEEIRNGSATYGRNTLGYSNSPYTDGFVTTNNLHDSSARLFSRSDILSYFGGNRHSINHIGHGSIYQCFKLNVLQAGDRDAIAALENPFPYFIYTQACLSGAFDSPNCFAEHFVTVSNGAAAAVMNARNGWASTSGLYGHSHYFHRHFWDSAFRGNAVTFGEMNEASRRANLASVPSHGGSYWRWVYYELNLFGDPALPVMPSLLNVPPSIAHTPLRNSYDTVSGHTIGCALEPQGIYDPQSPAVVWRSSAPGSGVVTQQMTRAGGNRYTLQIPPQPLYARIDYAIAALNRAGCAAAAPDAGMHTFHITDELTLLIAGSPASIGVCEPDYGVHSSASGLVVNASCADVHYDTPARRHICRGFVGTGSVPADSTNRFVSFRIDVDSMLIWRWTKEHRVTLTGSPDTTPDQVFWIEDAATFSPPAAESFVYDSQSNLTAFAGWKLNGSRSPALPAKSLPQHPPLIVTGEIELAAWYIPADQDVDGNGIADWFEYRYFGAVGNDIFADHDGDGFDLYEEFQDHSDPLDAAEFPAAPLISHTPLESTLTRPGPYLISAVITDTRAVAAAAVIWRINGGAWQHTPLTLLSNHIHRAVIAGAAAAGDLLSYRITAEDLSGNAAATPEWQAFLCYPIADFSLIEDLTVVTRPEAAAVTNYAFLLNRGNAPLNWSIGFGVAESVTGPSLDDLFNWNTASIEQPWRVATNRWSSPPYALHARLVSRAGSPNYASITLPPVQLGPGATLSFSHWMDGEVYTRIDPSRAFDGGIVEYSTDGGATFQRLKGPYTHTIYGWTMAPWPDRTPCFSGQSFGWLRITFNLAEEYPEHAGFEGQSVVFRFVYGGDDNTDHEGWYIDDIRITPAALPDGYTFIPPPLSPFTVAPGGYAPIAWRNLPHLLESRQTATTVFFESNAPTDACGSFQWRVLLRDAPLISAFTAAQIPGGRGAVDVDLQVCENDGEPLGLRIEWSENRGHTWKPAALTNLTWQPPHAALPDSAPDGTVTAIPGTADCAPATNRLNALWNSAAPTVGLTWVSNVTMRLTASSPWFNASRTVIFPVDNVPPAFTPGGVVAAPSGQSGSYLVSSGTLDLAWPPAIDTPPDGPVIYRIYSATNLLATATNLTQTLVALTGALDREHTLAVHAADRMGNSGEPLELAVLVLDADGDYDGDGMSTADEERAGTDAADPQSLFVIRAIQPGTDGTLRINWTSVTSRSYTVESAAGLDAAEWSPLPGFTALPGSGSVMTAILPMTATHAFFRVRASKE